MSTTNPVLNFAVSEKAEGDAWGTMVVSIVPYTSDPDGIDRMFTAWEGEYKQVCVLADGSEPPMPKAWRSAKSVARSAIKAGIPLLNEAGLPRGKSAVQADIKAAKTVSVEKDPLTVAAGLYATFVSYCTKHGLDLNTFGDIA